jgi:phenylacetate-CoA ligase
MRTELLPAFEMSDAKVEGFIARIREMRPRMVFGYPSAISHIAGYAEKKGIRLDDLGVKVVFVTSERLYDHQREVISRLFGAGGQRLRRARRGFHRPCLPVGLDAHHRRGHRRRDHRRRGRVQPPGQSGEIVVTHLATRDYPFVRYRTGDVGVLSEDACPCGRGLPILSEIQGAAPISSSPQMAP